MRDFMLSLPKELHAKVKFYSFKKGRTMTSFIIEAIEEKVKQEEGK